MRSMNRKERIFGSSSALCQVASFGLDLSGCLKMPVVDYIGTFHCGVYRIIAKPFDSPPKLANL